MNPAVYSLRTYALGSGALNTENAEIAIAEYTINQSMDEILGDLYERKPDVIGFSCYIWNWQMTKELMVEVKKLLPQTDIFLGGPEVSYDAPELLVRGAGGIRCHEGRRRGDVRRSSGVLPDAGVHGAAFGTDAEPEPEPAGKSGI